MLQIKIDQNAIQVLKNFGIFIEVEPPSKVPAHLNPEQPAPVVQSLPDLKIRSLAPTPAPQNGLNIVKHNGEELDSRGIAWNPDLHSANKTKTKDGEWRTKRNVDPAVAAQLQTPVQAAPPPVVQAPPPSPFGAPPTTSHVAATIQSTIAPIGEVKPPFQPAPAAPLPGVHAHTFQSFKNNLVEVFAALLNEGKIDQAYIDQLKGHFQVKELWNILASGKACEELYEQFCGYGLIQRVEG